MLKRIAIWLSSLSILAAQQVEATSTKQKCNPSSIPAPHLFGAHILHLSAAEVLNHSSYVPQLGGYLPGPLIGLDFCNVTVTYTHPGQNDTINVSIWLPLHDWNGRFQGTGGGGWNTGLGFLLLPPAIANGYAAASTDGGHAGPLDPASASVKSWAQLSPGNVNFYLLNDFASVALSDMTVIGKAVTKNFYGRPPTKSYWFGCSTGGRQGLMLAQRYPGLYDGILATAPAINWAAFLVAVSWAQHVINRIGVSPSRCELGAFTAEAIKACDGLDGLEDGIVGNPALCDFDPHSLVGKTYTCDGDDTKHEFSSAGAKVASAVWTGPQSQSGKRSWYGFNKDADMEGLTALSDDENDNPRGVNLIGDEWIRYFVTRDPDFSTNNITDDEFFSILHASRNQYDSIISANDPDLSDFHAAGGKMITWHGLSDPLIPPGGSEDYYKKVLALDPYASEYYRYFEAPGVAHCGNGPGPYPVDAFEKLVNWVEKDIVPDRITATFQNHTTRDICPYPLVQIYEGIDPDSPQSFECLNSRGKQREDFVVQT